MNLFKKLDLWSIMDELDKMTEYDYTCTEQKSIYWDYYSDQLRELCFLAADMYNELDQLKSKIYQKMPYKKIEFCSEDECFQTAIAWFNTAACMLSDTDMTVLLENENIYESDIAFEKQKRINALSRLTKEQQLFLYTESHDHRPSRWFAEAPPGHFSVPPIGGV